MAPVRLQIVGNWENQTAWLKRKLLAAVTTNLDSRLSCCRLSKIIAAQTQIVDILPAADCSEKCFTFILLQVKVWFNILYIITIITPFPYTFLDTEYISRNILSKRC